MKTRSLVFALLLLVGSASQKGIVDRGRFIVDINRQAQAAYPRVKILVIHYTADDFPGSLSTLTARNVSAHYLITANPPLSGGKPVIWQLVPEALLAWHAGASFWRGTTRINDISVGIELENQGYRRVGAIARFCPFSQPQIAVLEDLAKQIIARYNIAPQNVVAHGDIAPQRKVDPGPRFPWRQFAEKGIGAWPDAARVTFYLKGRSPWQPVDKTALLDLLSRYGYEVLPGMSDAQQKRVISAFQMHFRPADYNGEADAESQAIAEALLEKYGPG